MYDKAGMNLFKKSLVVFVYLCIGVGVYSLVPSGASAQQNTAAPLDITVYPSNIDLSANPGSTVQQRIRLRNNTGNSIPFAITTMKLTTNAQGDIIPADSKEGYISWISYSPSSFTALPNEWTDISLQIKIPSTAAFGYYYAVRIAPTNTNVKQTSNGSTLLGQALVPLLLDVRKPGEKANIQLVSFNPSQVFYEYLPATFNITFRNTGNVHIRPQGNVFIRTGSNDDAAILVFNEANGAMLPGQKRTYTASWDDGFLVQEPIVKDDIVQRDSVGNPKTHLVINWNKLTSFRIGKYSAHLLAVYNDGTRDIPLEATATFWVFPYKIILGSLAVLILIIIIGRLWIKSYVARQIKKYQNK